MSGLISVFVYCFMVAWNTICLRRFSSPAPAISPYRWAERAVQYARLHLGTDDGGLTVTALPVVIMYALSERFIKSG